jgi:nucleotide-binding universal stress UspA family protein
MTTNPDSHRPVVVGVDGSPQASRALDWAATEAGLRGAPLVVLWAYSPDYPAVRALGQPGPPPPQPKDALHTVAQEGCSRAVEQVRRTHPTLAVTDRCVARDAGAALVDESSTADLVVMGARGLGTLRGVLLGSVSSYVTTRSHCPVVVVREAPGVGAGEPRVVVGVDGLEDSAAALRFAFDAAARHGASLTVVHTWDLDVDTAAASMTWSVDWQQAGEQEQAVVAEAVAGYAAEFPTVDVRRHVVHGHPVAELARESEGADLLVLGTRGRGPVKGLVLGSVSRSLLHEAHCPVAVVPTPGGTSTQHTADSPRHELHLPVPPVRERL